MQRLDDTKPDPAVPKPLAQLDLADNELECAANYLLAVESLANARCQATACTMLILLGVILFPWVVDDKPAAFGSLRALVDVVGGLAPIMLAVTLALTAIAGSSVDRQLDMTTLSADAKRYLRRLAAGMEAYIFKRTCRRIASHLAPRKR